VKDDSDNEEQSEMNEEPIVEDLTDIKDCIEVTAISDWDKRFKLASYTEEQRRMVVLSNEKMRDWMELFRKSDWTE